jgi:hypothetical protein
VLKSTRNLIYGQENFTGMEEDAPQDKTPKSNFSKKVNDLKFTNFFKKNPQNQILQFKKLALNLNM